MPCELEPGAQVTRRLDGASEATYVTTPLQRGHVSITTRQELLLDELRHICSAEKQAIRSYPRIAKVASSTELKQALQGSVAPPPVDVLKAFTLDA